MKSVRDEMEIVNADELVGTYRGAAALCGTTTKTVKRVLERHRPNLTRIDTVTNPSRTPTNLRKLQRPIRLGKLAGGGTGMDRRICFTTSLTARTTRRVA